MWSRLNFPPDNSYYMLFRHVLLVLLFSQGHVSDGDVSQGVSRGRLGLLVAALEPPQDDFLMRRITFLVQDVSALQRSALN